MKTIAILSFLLLFGVPAGASAEPYEKRLPNPICSNTIISELSARLGEMVKGKFFLTIPKTSALPSTTLTEFKGLLRLHT